MTQWLLQGQMNTSVTCSEYLTNYQLCLTFLVWKFVLKNTSLITQSCLNVACIKLWSLWIFMKVSIFVALVFMQWMWWPFFTIFGSRSRELSRMIPQLDQRWRACCCTSLHLPPVLHTSAMSHFLEEAALVTIRSVCQPHFYKYVVVEIFKSSKI